MDSTAARYEISFHLYYRDPSHATLHVMIKEHILFLQCWNERYGGCGTETSVLCCGYDRFVFYSCKQCKARANGSAALMQQTPSVPLPAVNLTHVQPPTARVTMESPKDAEEKANKEKEAPAPSPPNSLPEAPSPLIVPLLRPRILSACPSRHASMRTGTPHTDPRMRIRAFLDRFRQSLLQPLRLSSPLISRLSLSRPS
jgi:hypothetical protein